MNNTITQTKVDAKTSDILFNYVFKYDTHYNVKLKQAKEYIINIGEDRYSAEELVRDFLDRL